VLWEGLLDGWSGLAHSLMFTRYGATKYLLARYDKNISLEEWEMDVGIVTTHIAPALGYGGVSVTAAILTRALARLGYKIVLCSSDESISGRLRPEDLRLGDNVAVQLYQCYLFRRWGFGLGAIPKIFSLCWRSPNVYIHGVATWPCTLGAIFCAVLRRRFIVAPHGGLMPEHVALIRRKKPHKWLYYKSLTLPTLRRAAAVHCTSETEAEGVRALLGNQAKIVIIPNGVEAREIAIAARPGGEGVAICFLGHIQPEKGINAFIRVWLKCRRDEDRLIVAGSSMDSRYFEDFRQLVRQSNGAISYKGYVNRSGAIEILANSHYLVLPSGLEEAGGMRENFGNVVAEAMAAGRPVIVANGLAWGHVESLGAGLVFDRNEQAVCDALHRAHAAEASTWQAMGMKARQYVEEHLDTDRLAQQVWDVLVGNQHE
jgi:glycosyltransferase involved in cell wall biosynthesis